MIIAARRVDELKRVKEHCKGDINCYNLANFNQ